MESTVFESRCRSVHRRKTMSGSFVSARAIANALCSPPESSAGKWLKSFGQTTSLSWLPRPLVFCRRQSFPAA